MGVASDIWGDGPLAMDRAGPTRHGALQRANRSIFRWVLIVSCLFARIGKSSF